MLYQRPSKPLSSLALGNPCLPRRKLTEINGPLENPNFIDYVQEPPLKIRKPEARKCRVCPILHRFPPPYGPIRRIIRSVE
tara:strand:- start:491 stop:733 length:243 start_codon:yes stop_codon:yes gene_type:complete